MVSYAATIAALTRTIRDRETALPLRSEQCRSRFFLHDRPTSKICLFFHGFTAGPYQFGPLGETLYQAGYNVLVPLMPGHCRAGNWGRENPPPLPTDPEVYQRFALAWLQQAQLLGRQVVVGGLSGGGTLATWLALNQSRAIYRTLLFAPYLSGSSKVVDLFVRRFDGYFEWISPNPRPDNPAYRGFQMPALQVFLEMGQENLKKAKQQQMAPLFAISSESDRGVDNRDHRILFERALVHQPKCWYLQFNRVLDIPHAMMTAADGNDYEHLLITLAKAYIDSDLTWDEIEEIGFRMAQGRTFQSVVNELNLADRAAPEMPAMMTMIDKRAIVTARQEGAKHRDR